ncbi:vWA domain-containing protein [Ilyomonas limi]|uniref:vWA domain-containing protein n=1 Tax=Ilyomonas limi TaxID=2575867 RepID=UPI0014856003|nr:VWA domain-containing protein [Ilyomonas limi]
MKIVIAILCCCWCCLHADAQYYLRGEVKDKQGRLLPNVKIQLESKGSYVFYTGALGSFGIPVPKKEDSIILSLDGYEVLGLRVEASKYQIFVLQPLNTAASSRSGLMSFTKNLFSSYAVKTITNGAETYNALVENDFVHTKDAAETGLSLNINCASYSNIRRFLNMESTVPPDGVRIEEMLNYFDLNTIKQAPTNNTSFLCKTQVTSCPWNADNQLLFIQLLAPKLNLKAIPPAHLTFLIDVSGSMDKDNRLPLVQHAFKMLVKNLRAQDTVAIVTYGGYVGIALQPTGGAEKNKIVNVIDSLVASGDTPGSAAIQTAYSVAEKMYDAHANNRVILATDGDFNVGQTSDKELQNIVAAHKQSGIYLTCLGIGMGNYKDSKLEALATNGNGNFAYIDNLKEAERTLMTEFTKTMYAVANDAFLTVTFNKDLISAYRLIGFDNKKDDLSAGTATIEGGEIGSGHTVMAMFEITPATPSVNSSSNIATLQLRYKQPQAAIEQQQHFDVTQNFISLNEADSALRFATSIAMFGSLLKNSTYANNYNWDDVRNMAVSGLDANNVLEQEFVTLTNKAEKVYAGVTDKRKRNKLL